MSEPSAPAAAAAPPALGRTVAPRDIVITNPYVWPHVRRGSERMLHLTARYLHARGHRVAVIATAPEPGVEMRDGVEYRLLPFRGPRTPRQLNGLHAFALEVARAMRDRPCDAALCLTYYDACGMLSARARRARPFRLAYYFTGIPVRRYFRAVPIDAWMMRRVVRDADALAVASAAAGAAMRGDFGRSAEVLPPPVELETFACAAEAPAPVPPDERPLVLFVGAADEPRKGAAALCRAFALVKAARPGATLVVSGPASDATRQALLALLPAPMRPALRFLGVGDVAALPALYAAADVTVLPATWEAFGLVLVESLAAGTPVVAARHGGIPEIVEDLPSSRLVDPAPLVATPVDATALAQAILEVVAAGKPGDVRRACQARAARYALACLGPRFERLLGVAADG